MSIDRNTANADSNTALTAIQTAADTDFIANVDGQITAAIALGQFNITALTNKEVNIQTVFQYYSDLGYAVSFPDYANQNGAVLPSVINQPQNFFGYNWTAYWQGILTLNLVTNPCRMTIAWP